MVRSLFLATLLMSSSASGAEQITSVRDTYPSLSPDGEQVVFQSNRSGQNELWIAAIDGSELRQLTNSPAGQGAESPVWSPDGRQILFARYLGVGNNDVFVMPAEGGEIRQLSDGPGYDGHPHWSADGQRIVFNSDRTSPDLTVPWGERWHEIFSMRADGSDVRQHTRCRAICTYGSLSPDGEKLLYRRSVDEPALNWALGAAARNSEIALADIDGGNEVILASSPAFDGWPIWSPDGRWIAFASNRAGPSRTGHVWIMRPDGSELSQLTGGGLSHVQPSWAPDGKAVWVFRAHEEAGFEAGGLARVPFE